MSVLVLRVVQSLYEWRCCSRLSSIFPPNNSRQCLRITASTCLLRVIIDYQYCRVSPNGFAPPNEIFYASLLKGAAHQRGAKSACEVYWNLYHKSQVRLKSDNDGLRGSLLDTPPHRAVTVGARLLTRDNPICRISLKKLSCACKSSEAGCCTHPACRGCR